MESLQLRVETTIESIENRFHDADNFLKERMDNLYDGLTATEEQLKDIQLVGL